MEEGVREGGVVIGVMGVSAPDVIDIGVMGVGVNGFALGES